MSKPPVKRGRGRPREGARVEIRLPDELLARIDQDRALANLTRAEQIRQILLHNYRPWEDG